MTWRFLRNVAGIVIFPVLLAIYSYMFIGYVSDLVKNEPGQTYKQELLTPVVHLGEPLIFVVDFKAPASCTQYSLRRIFDKDRRLIWLQLGLPTDIDLATRKVKVYPALPPGEYRYQATIHFVCQDESFVRNTKLFQFSVE